jgi:hypothetical protein
MTISPLKPPYELTYKTLPDMMMQKSEVLRSYLVAGPSGHGHSGGDE